MNQKESRFIFPAYISSYIPINLNPSKYGLCSEALEINSIYSFKQFSAKIKNILLKKNETPIKIEGTDEKNKNPKNITIEKNKNQELNELVHKKEEIINKDELIIVLKGLMHEKITGVVGEIKGSIKCIFQSFGEANKDIKSEVNIFLS